MSNPFQIIWLKGWTFQIVIMEGDVNVEAYGFGICLRTTLLAGESPKAAADRLVISEQKRRESLHKVWLKRNATDQKISTMDIEASENLVIKKKNLIASK